jgi:glycosyltransferase involved in cell wall biosynthesis
MSDRRPRVSVILPTFNRARFLPGAFASIRDQTLGDWELVVIDDGSTDDTARIVSDESRTMPGPVVYRRQENQGAYGARNTGLDLARGTYVAFFDSDDLWLPHHLARSVAALDDCPDVDWVYAACRLVNDSTGAVLGPTTFEVEGQPRPFLRLRTKRARDLHVFDDEGVLHCQIEHGLYAGLQNSVIRREVFEPRRFWPDYRVTEDVQFLVRALNDGIRLGYLTDVHVVYRVHGDNSSGSVAGGTPDRLIPVYEEQARGLARLDAECALGAAERRALRRQLSRVYFWRLGYAGYRAAGRRADALRAFSAGLALSPFDPAMWKTYAAARARALFEGPARER